MAACRFRSRVCAAHTEHGLRSVRCLGRGFSEVYGTVAIRAIEVRAGHRGASGG